MRRNPIDGDYRVWWIPQTPMKPFYVHVESASRGWWLCDVLAAYDAFRYEQRVNPDFSNGGGVEVMEDGEWHDVEDDI